ncbi:MAG: 5,10-methylenetetrahydrofolate reductase [Bdellovibrio sp. ArHS]|uniref:methylenetetrahydrofolate reductase n=1 Tax=Bdellovibrio sp. ArHS TaxID=1569284 RepID=UPI0005827AE6|nr:methylenetetrahydrofolate reductase [Bdellovibrio sp. ArHS]KHD90007.1 MAG: 5,10-methylenetetrahydrofolate reductase [Bdellovibrio sp. ArHS]
MKVIEHIEKAQAPLFSYEIVPPPRGRSIKDIIEVVEALAPLNPPWIDVTSHSSTSYFQERIDGTIQKKTLKKRPGTLGICGVIQNRFKIDTVAHILCLGFTREETEDALIELSFLGIENVLALRGDTPNFQKQIRVDRTVNSYASGLVSQIKDLRDGKFLDDLDRADSLDFCVGVAGYPEKHFEAACLKNDIQNLKKKVEAGADYIVTQMFFDNQKYFDFVTQCREAGITVPIIPGLKVLKSANQLKTIPKNFYIDLPEELVDGLLESPQHAAEIGMNWCRKQVEGLLNFGVPAVHFYVLNDVHSIVKVVKGFK